VKGNTKRHILIKFPILVIKLKKKTYPEEMHIVFRGIKLRIMGPFSFFQMQKIKAVEKHLLSSLRKK
jgi:hypothetical protein